VTLSGVLGQSDTADPNFQVRVRVLGDGQPLFEKQFGFGVTEPMSVDVRGRLRVRIELSIVNPPEDCCGDGVVAAIGDARFSGAPQDIDALVRASSP
jgi:hypothetical protein